MNKQRKILYLIICLIGFMGMIGSTARLLQMLIQINFDKIISYYEPNQFILTFEIIFLTITFICFPTILFFTLKSILFIDK